VVGGLNAAQQVVKIRPDWRSGFETLAYCQALAGRREEARRSALHLTEVPGALGDALAPLRAREPAWATQIEETIRELQSV
jgi:hypothetical protein